MQLSDFDFNLPEALIAQSPPKNRTDSRLLVPIFPIIDTFFRNIGDFIKEGDLLVMNNTKVIPARLFGYKESGGKVEIMIERLLSNNQALAMIRASRAPKIGSHLILENKVKAVVLNKDKGFYTLEFATDSLLDLLDKVGHTPLPPYIERADNEQDLSRYQTVFAQKDGAVAAPTAGLHFDEDLLDSLKTKGVDSAFVTLHVGAGTFQPVKTDNIKDHHMHSEYYEVPQETVDKITQTKANGGRVIAVGTTAVRSLESAARGGALKAIQEETDIFIYPGYKFQVIDILITNFHLPKSSLLMLVSAFIGRDRMMEIYQHAIDEKYRFFSYGDAMLLERI
ncbi:MAG: tRNA preQ1(34) S-adenosylmethionine ribosyltransferase-isomerase QueA [Candidatus Thiodubiliella endoseptemdiera]|uniref:S-adenosylmethionine:tRNA ribosyltransferase-isomerase n=1 Tax=Candidatus Thiodubiliella endoseptemdiera TaxID=2738886 RepID=A0A853F1J2_9GAMM|nr:tRNA preQ1(34) S-adenosylmethionine ribosyltransferase-isomerase QueA [Candidatus Thiodubiliella endoseptemdiera]